MTLHERLAAGLRRAFLEHGYEHLTMSTIASVCGLTRRALYHHFSSKEEAFRFWLRHSNEAAVTAGFAAARGVLEASGDAIDVVTTLVDVRYGDNRRRLAASPHALEINDQAFRRCRDIMDDSARAFQAGFAELLAEMAECGLFALRSEPSPADLAQILADGARGVNQSRPAASASELATRYRNMCAAILYGTVDPAGAPPVAGSPAPPRLPRRPAEPKP